MGQHYGEWAEPSDVHAMSYRDFMTSRPEEATAYLSYVMGIMAEIAGELGKNADIPMYEEYRDGAKATYQKLIRQPKFSIDTDRQARLVRPLYMKLLDEKDTAFAKKRLIEALDHYNWRVGTGFLSTPFILYVLGEIDKEYAYKLLENEEKPGWLCMPKAGATTIWRTGMDRIPIMERAVGSHPLTIIPRVQSASGFLIRCAASEWMAKTLYHRPGSGMDILPMPACLMTAPTVPSAVRGR